MSTQAKKAGRPPAKIDLVELEKLASMQCTDEEIAAWFRVSTKTIQRRKEHAKFCELLEQGRNRGKLSLRRAQLQAALNGNITAQIWLGKQWLGQSDRTAVEYSGSVEITERLNAARKRLIEMKHDSSATA